MLRAGVRDALALVVVEPLGGMAREVLRARAGHENNTDYDDHQAAITSIDRVTILYCNNMTPERVAVRVSVPNAAGRARSRETYG